jgi:hypothetical protein
MKNGFFALAIALLLSLFGCGEATETTAAVCAPGHEEMCKCESGLNGTRQCLPSSLGYTQCDCFGPGRVDGSTGPPLDAVAPLDGGSDVADIEDTGPSLTDAVEPPPEDTVEVFEDAQQPGVDATDATDIDAASVTDVNPSDAGGSDVDSADAEVFEDASDAAEEGDEVELPPTCEADLDCDDQDPCTDEVCMVTAGLCVYDDMWTDGFPCDGDQDPCTQGGSCLSGACVPGETLDCSSLDSTCGVGVCVPDGPGLATCATAPANEGFPCDDASVCTVDDVCAEGACAGAAFACEEDGDPCTQAGCDPGTGCTQEASADAAPCDDGDVCTQQDACNQGSCGGLPVDCPGDDNSCTLDVCVVDQGGCAHLNQPEGTLCQDGQGCTINDSCTGGSCQPGQLKPCDTGDPCSADLCDFFTEQCASTPIVGCDADLEPCDPASGLPCDGGVCDPGTNACVPCITADDCDGGGLACVAKQCVPAVLCEAVESCAIVEGVCDEATGLCMQCVSSADCQDGLTCTAGACQDEAPPVCSEGACVGLHHFQCAPTGTMFLIPEASCDDGDVCSTDYCSATQGCVHTHSDEPCDDDDACTSDDACAFGSCSGTPSVPCADDDPCDGTLTCDAATGTCVNSEPLLCDDSQACNGLESCDPDTGECVPGTPKSCEDNDLCNGVEVCDEESGDCLPGVAVTCDDNLTCNGLETCDTDTGDCLTGAPVVCSDGVVCNGFETCDAGVDECIPGSPIECSDGDACNGLEECYGPGFCTASEDVVCVDGDLCNGTEVCEPSSGLCLAGTALSCDDSDPCTNDYCTAEIGCSHIYIPACDDGLCDDVDCSDEDPCTENVCNPSTGQCEASETHCDDLDPCTVDTCDGSVEGEQDPCVHTVDADCQPCTDDLDCSDDDLCTIDQCDTLLAVCDFTNLVICDDDNGCSADGCAPESGCTFEAIKPCPGLDCAFDFECSDDSACTIDTCEIAPGAATGDCLHTLIECDDNDPCHTGACDPNVGVAGGCVFSDLDCDDGNVCTLDTCGTGPEGGCAYGENPCDDGDPCTADSCDGLTQECEQIPVEGCDP